MAPNLTINWKSPFPANDPHKFEML